MARTKQTKTVAPPEILDLHKTIDIEGQTYNINAVNADLAAKVHKSLNITLAGAETAEGFADVEKTFDGSESVAFSVVSAADGGEFAKPIRVPIVGADDLTNDNEVLSYKTILELTSKLTGLGWSTWDGNNLTYVTENNIPERLVVVIGDDEDRGAFATANSSLKIKQFLYIASNTGNMYLGTYPVATESTENTESTKLIWLSKDVDSATKLATARNLQVNLEKTNSEESEFESFDGTEDAVDIGVTGVLSTTNGGTGTTSLADVIVGKADALTTQRLIKINLASTNGANFDGTKSINPGVYGNLKVTNGGTGADTATGAIANIINNNSISPSNIQISTAQQICTPDAQNYGLDLNNSDIIRLNGLWFADQCDGPSEGIHFKHSDAANPTWDRLLAKNGGLYFVPNTELGDAGTAYTVFHSGMTSNPIPVANGGTGATNLTNITVGKATADANGTNIRTGYYRAVSYPSNANTITISTSDPSGGADGDIWIKYT